MMSSRTVVRAFLCALLVAVSTVVAQITPSVSTNPLGTSSFTTPFFSPEQTFTPNSGFPVNTPVTTTAISGTAGPSPATGAYTFSYDIPLQSATMTPLSSLYASLASAGLPTAYTSAFQPNPTNLQIVDGAHSSYQPALAIMFSVGMGVAAGIFYL